MTALASSLPAGLRYASLRGPYALGRHSGWFAPGHRFDRTVKWFEEWVDDVTTPGHPVVLAGFSAGAAFAGGAIVLNPARYLGAAILFGTLPFDAGLPTPPGRLNGKRVFVAHSRDDPQMPHDLLDRAWEYLTDDCGAVAEAKRYDCGHELPPDVLDDLSAWLTVVTAQ